MTIILEELEVALRYWEDWCLYSRVMDHLIKAKICIPDDEHVIGQDGSA